MIAACELPPPATETAPARPASASSIRSAGLTSRRTRMKSPAGRGGAPAAARWSMTARPTWRTSPARSAISGTASPASTAAWASVASVTAVGRVGPARDRGHGGPHQRGIRCYQGRHADDVRLGGPAGHAKSFGQIVTVGGDRGERLADLLSRRIGGRARVGDVEQPRGHPLGHWLTREAGGLAHVACRAATSRRAPRISAIDAAPGSSCPTLRGPR